MVAIVAFFGVGVYRLILSIPDLISANVSRFSSQVVEVLPSIVDPVQGLVSLETRFQVFKVPQQDWMADVSGFPVTLNLCLFAKEGDSSPISLQCWDRVFAEPRQLEPVLQYQSSLYLPTSRASFGFFVQASLRHAEGFLWSGSTDPVSLVWSPQSRIRLLDGHELTVGEPIGSESAITLMSRVDDVRFLLDGRQVFPSLVVSPPANDGFIMVDQPAPALYQWIYPLPQQAVSPSSQFCAQVGESPTQCYPLMPSLLSGMNSSCGNAVVEAGEECDDGNQDESDACTSQCVTNLFRSVSLNYPLPVVSVQPLADARFSLFARLEPVHDHSVPPEELFIRMVRDQGESILSEDVQRVNGLPFFQAFLAEDEFVQLDFIHRTGDMERVFQSTLVDTRFPDPLVQDLKSAAESPVSGEGVISHGDFGVLDVKWLGSERSQIDYEGQVVTDLTGERVFQTRVVAQSGFDQEVKLLLRFADESVSFTHTLSPRATEEIPMSIPDVAYGDHRLVISAVFPDGQRSADIVFPFRYTSNSLSSMVVRQWWQIGAIGVLILLGFAYAVFRVGRAASRRTME